MTESTHSNCESLLGFLSDYVDGELGAELCREIEKHIAECEDCRIVVDTTRKTIDLVHASNDPQSWSARRGAGSPLQATQPR